jgi:pyrroloquinoline-quinone synthase
MDIRAQFDAVVAEFDLLQHPFYQAWSAGTLPAAALADYANDWASFIGLVPDGWDAHGDGRIAAEEREHRSLWEDFARGLGVETGAARSEGAQRLASVASRHFSQPASSLGALYAFEAQQPHTSASKLKGLREHYRLPESAHVYFEVHETDFAEPALLMERIEALSPAEQAQALVACRETAQALWDGLTSLHAPYVDC